MDITSRLPGPPTGGAPTGGRRDTAAEERPHPDAEARRSAPVAVDDAHARTRRASFAAGGADPRRPGAGVGPRLSAAAFAAQGTPGRPPAARVGPSASPAAAATAPSAARGAADAVTQGRTEAAQGAADTVAQGRTEAEPQGRAAGGAGVQGHPAPRPTAATAVATEGPNTAQGRVAGDNATPAAAGALARATDAASRAASRAVRAEREAQEALAAAQQRRVEAAARDALTEAVTDAQLQTTTELTTLMLSLSASVDELRAQLGQVVQGRHAAAQAAGVAETPRDDTASWGDAALVPGSAAVAAASPRTLPAASPSRGAATAGAAAGMGAGTGTGVDGGPRAVLSIKPEGLAVTASDLESPSALRAWGERVVAGTQALPGQREHLLTGAASLAHSRLLLLRSQTAADAVSATADDVAAGKRPLSGAELARIVDALVDAETTSDADAAIAGLIGLPLRTLQQQRGRPRQKVAAIEEPLFAEAYFDAATGLCQGYSAALATYPDAAARLSIAELLLQTLPPPLVAAVPVLKAQEALGRGADLHTVIVAVRSARKLPELARMVGYQRLHATPGGGGSLRRQAPAWGSRRGAAHAATATGAVATSGGTPRGGAATSPTAAADGAPLPRGAACAIAAMTAATDTSPLPTHVVTVGGLPARVLVDSATEVNIITLDAVTKLGLLASVDSSISIRWAGTAGTARETALGSVLVHIRPPAATGVLTDVPVALFVARGLPGGVELLLRSPSAAPAAKPFWRWRATESRRLAGLPSKTAVRRVRRRVAHTPLASCLTRMLPLPAGAQWDALRDSAFAGPDEPEEERTLEERVADDAAAGGARAPDFATAPLDIPSDTLPAEEAALRALLAQHAAAFTDQPRGIATTPCLLPSREGAVPTRAPGNARRVLNVPKRDAMHAALQKLQAQGIITRCAPGGDKTFAGQVVMVPKPHTPGAWRLTVDFKQYNEVVAVDTSDLPDVIECLSALAGSTRFAKFDLKAGFFQIPLDARTRHKTRFVTDIGDFEFLMLPMGVANGPGYCQRMMDDVFGPLQAAAVASAYMDDLQVGNRRADADVGGSWARPPGVRDCWAGLLHNVDLTLRAAVARRVVFGFEKSSFGHSRSKFLGQLQTANGRAIDPSRFDGLRAMGEPADKKQLKSFVALASYFRDFVPHMATLTLPFAELTADHARWSWTRAAV